MANDVAAISFVPAADERAACSHCGLPVPDELYEREAELNFCCAGCRSVFFVLRECRLDDYYRLRSAAGEQGQRAKTTDKSYAEYDEDAFQAVHADRIDDEHLSIELFLEGVHCSACVWVVEKLPRLVPGVRDARLDFGRSIVRLVWDPSEVPLSKAAATLDSLGYPPHPRRAPAENRERQRDRALLARVGVAGAAAGNAMLFAVALYAGAFDGMAAEFVDLFRWGGLVVTIPAVFWSASVFFRGAASAVRTRTPHMDVPISVGILAGTLSGVANTLRADGEVYFDSVAVLIFLLLVGRYLERRQRRKVDGLAASLMSLLAPSSARVVEGHDIREVPVACVETGGLVEIRAGERVPVDGMVVEGASSIDRALLTGESVPVSVGPGARVEAGCINVGSRLLVRTERAGRSTRLAKLVEHVDRTAERRPPITRLLDRIAGYFILGVLALASLTVALWSWLDPEQAVSNAVAVLIVTCPCALGLGAPLAFTVALGRAAKRGLLVKGAPPLEAMAKRGLIVFDKTGTLTEGRLELMAYEGPAEARSWIAAVESHSAHPIARALCNAFSDVPVSQVSDFLETIGGGVEARLEGRLIRIGSAAFVAGEVAALPEWAFLGCDAFAARAWTPIVVAVDGEITAVLALGDPVRPDARATLGELARLGYRLALLSGDHPRVVDAVAHDLGVELEAARGAVTPEQKLAYVEAARQTTPVFMVGDGVNDAAALSAATVGIAVHGGAEASLAAADVFTTRSGLEPVIEIFRGARKTLRVIRRCLTFSLTYNLLGAALAVAGLVSPLVAAVLMPLSSLTVVSIAFRSRTFGDPS